LYNSKQTVKITLPNKNNRQWTTDIINYPLSIIH